jgi:hypothetical protein
MVRVSKNHRQPRYLINCRSEALRPRLSAGLLLSVSPHLNVQVSRAQMSANKDIGMRVTPQSRKLRARQLSVNQDME